MSDENVCKLGYKIYYVENERVFYDVRLEIFWFILKYFFLNINKNC